MASIQSKVTARGQITVPADVRRQLGIRAGSVLIWEWRDGEFVVRRAGKYTSAEIHEAVFGTEKPARSAPKDIKQGIRKYIRYHARG